jgi:hypothetical protein
VEEAVEQGVAGGGQASDGDVTVVGHLEGAEAAQLHQGGGSQAGLEDEVLETGPARGSVREQEESLP